MIRENAHKLVSKVVLAPLFVRACTYLLANDQYQPGYGIRNLALIASSIHPEVWEVMRQGLSDVNKRSAWKHLGLLHVYDGPLPLELTYPDGSPLIHRSEPVIRLHLEKTKFKRGEAWPHVTDSLRLVAQYMERHAIKTEHVFGISYERAARASRFLGFSVIDAPLPQYLVDNFNEQRENQGINPRGSRKLLVCFKTQKLFFVDLALRAFNNSPLKMSLIYI